MFEKMQTGESNESSKNENLKKAVVGITAAGLAMGAAETVIAAKDATSESQDKKIIEQKSEVDYAQLEKQRIEQKAGGKLEISATEKEYQQNVEEYVLSSLKKRFPNGEEFNVKMARIKPSMVENDLGAFFKYIVKTEFKTPVTDPNTGETKWIRHAPATAVTVSVSGLVTPSTMNEKVAMKLAEEKGL
jgi:hypothetical protein